MDTLAVGATTRLRRTFKYPSDDEDGTEASHDEMDEEEQEQLLADLRASEIASNRRYTLILTGLPLVVVLPFLRYLTASPTKINMSTAMLCLLSITSLMASAYVMYFIPISGSDSSSSLPGPSRASERFPSSIFAAPAPDSSSGSGSGLSPSYAQSSQGQGGQHRPRPRVRGMRLPVLTLSNADVSASPVTRYLPTLNAAIGVLLFLASMAYYRHRPNSTASNPYPDGPKPKPNPEPEGLWLFLLLPPLIFVMVYLAKRSMRDIQTGLGELQALRYEYKGA